jgi:hypothetical protein
MSCDLKPSKEPPLSIGFGVEVGWEDIHQWWKPYLRLVILKWEIIIGFMED